MYIQRIQERTTKNEITRTEKQESRREDQPLIVYTPGTLFLCNLAPPLSVWYQFSNLWRGTAQHCWQLAEGFASDSNPLPVTRNKEKKIQKHNEVANVDGQMILLEEFCAGTRARGAGQILGSHCLDSLGGFASFHFRNVCNNSRQ